MQSRNHRLQERHCDSFEYAQTAGKHHAQGADLDSPSPPGQKPQFPLRLEERKDQRCKPTRLCVGMARSRTLSAAEPICGVIGKYGETIDLSHQAQLPQAT